MTTYTPDQMAAVCELLASLDVDDVTELAADLPEAWRADQERRWKAYFDNARTYPEQFAAREAAMLRRIAIAAQ